MKLDVLSGLDTVKVCTSYRDPSGNTLDELPNDGANFEGMTPEYIELPGWEEDITEARTFGDLPENAKSFVNTVQRLTKLHVAVISVGPERDALVPDSMVDVREARPW